jgi:hypothetical protein
MWFVRNPIIPAMQHVHKATTATPRFLLRARRINPTTIHRTAATDRRVGADVKARLLFEPSTATFRIPRQILVFVDFVKKLITSPSPLGHLAPLQHHVLGAKLWLHSRVTDQGVALRVALVAGATRGAGRAIAVELARAGLFVYATGRSSRVAGRSEIGRPETIEETGDLIDAAGGTGMVLVVDHEDLDAVAT